VNKRYWKCKWNSFTWKQIK